MGSAAYVRVGPGDFCPTGLLVAGIPSAAGPTIIQLSAPDNLDLVGVGSAALIDNEIVRVDAINLETLSVTIARGCVDTVPAAHSAGARVWFFEDYVGEDPTEYSSGVSVQVRLRTVTSSGTLAPELAGTDTLGLVGRQALPYPPGNLRLNGASYPTEVTGEVTVSVSHRDRLLQADQLIDTLQGDIGPEAGTEYRFRFYSGTTLLRTIQQAGTSYTYPLATEISDGGPFNPLRVVVDSIRSGLSSFQAHDVSVGRVLDVVTLIAATSTVYAESTSQTKVIPSSSQPGDLLLAIVMHRSDLTSPSGWTLVRTASVAVSGGTGTHRLSVYSRTAVAGDEGSDTLWVQASSQRIAVVLQVYRRPGAVVGVVAHAGRTGFSGPYTVAEVAATADSQRAVVAITFNGAPIGSVSPPDSYLLSTPGSGADNRLGIAHRSLSSGSSSTGAFLADPAGTSGTAHAQISLIVG